MTYILIMNGTLQAPPGVAKPMSLGNSPSLSSSPVPPPGVVAPVPIPPVSVVVPQLGSAGIVTTTALGMVMPPAVEGVPGIVPTAVVAPTGLGVVAPVPVPTSIPGMTGFFLTHTFVIISLYNYVTLTVTLL